jgi:dTMP kinase
MEIIHNFVVFEGGDGSGTTTQIKLLGNRFSREKAAGQGDLPGVWLTFEPTDGPIGGLIRSALGGEFSFRGETIARLFSADRHEHLYGAGGILERCSRGELVVSDRYAPSSMVYQGIECGEALPEVLNASFPGPELILFFDLEAETALERIRTRPGRDIYEYADFQKAVREAYKALLPKYAARGSRVEIIDASRPREDVAEEVWRAVEKLPIMGGR